MKIGIVTFNSAYSYGAVLQAYALQTYLKKIGHEPYFINYKDLDRPFSCKPAGLLLKMRWMLMRTANRWLLHHYFRDFHENVLKRSPCEYYNAQQVMKHPPAADAYICGSDQIWHPLFTFSQEEDVVWLNFGADQVRRLSYAASFGDLDLDAKTCTHWAEHAARLNSISVREQDAVGIAGKLNRADAVWVPDPTLLLTAEDYSSVIPENSAQAAVFSYLLVSPWKMYKKAKEIIREELGGPFHDCRPTNLKHNLLRGGLVKPGHWLALIHNAKLVLTDSYHGLLFSLIFHRPFVILRSRPSRRIQSILQLVGLEERLMTYCDEDRLKNICRKQVNWAAIDARIREFRDCGTGFLNRSLS